MSLLPIPFMILKLILQQILPIKSCHGAKSKHNVHGIKNKN